MSNQQKKLPMVLMLQRKSIRMFPKNVTVGLYYSDMLGKYFSISTKDDSIMEVKEYESD